jgi:hypothetical protein
MGVPNVFGSATTSIPLSQLDQNFNTTATLGNAAIGLGNVTTTVGNLTLTNVNITSGTINAAVTQTGFAANAVIYSNTSGNLTGNASVFTVDSSGNVGINNTSPAVLASTTQVAIKANASADSMFVAQNSNGLTTAKFGFQFTGSVDNPVIGSYTNHPFLFLTNNTERMRITSAGDVGIGNTGSTSFKFNVTGTGTSSAAYAFRAEDSGTNALLAARNDGFIITGTRGVSPYNNTTSNSANMYVDSVGGLYRSTSSLKYKTNVQDATHGLEDLLKLRSVTYKQKNTDADGNPVNTVFGGLIAEEVDAAGFTEFVQYAEDGSPDALAYGNMVSLCVKAIQELNAKVITLEEQIINLGVK